MLSKRIRNILCGLLIGLGLWAVVHAGLSTFYNQVSDTKYQHSVSVQEKEVDYSNLVIQGLQELNKLEVLQLNMNYDMTIHGTKFNNDFFRNDKIVTLNSTGRYKIDLSDIKNNIIFNGNNLTILVKIEKEVFINEDLTEYKDNKGYLIWGDVEITPEKYNEMVSIAESQLLHEMGLDCNMDIAKEKVEAKIIDIVNTLGHNTYNINIKWI